MELEGACPPLAPLPEEDVVVDPEVVSGADGAACVAESVVDSAGAASLGAVVAADVVSFAVVVSFVVVSVVAAGVEVAAGVVAAAVADAEAVAVGVAVLVVDAAVDEQPVTSSNALSAAAAFHVFFSISFPPLCSYKIPEKTDEIMFTF